MFSAFLGLRSKVELPMARRSATGRVAATLQRT
jgi:hypothetical protein